MQKSDRPEPALAIGLRAWCVGSFIEWQTGLSQQDSDHDAVNPQDAP